MSAILVAIISIVVGGDDGAVTPSSVYADVASAIAERAELRAISSEEMFVADSSLFERIQDCGSESACIAGELRALRAQLGLVVIVNRDVTPPLIALRLIDVAEARQVGSNVAPLAEDEVDISRAIRARSRRLFDAAGHPASARLAVLAQPPEATVIVERADAATVIDGAGNVYLLPRGRYRVRVFAAGHRPETREVEAEPGREAKLDITLEHESSPTDSPWLWIGAGAAVLIGAAAIFFVARGTECVCVAAPGVECPPC